MTPVLSSPSKGLNAAAPRVATVLTSLRLIALAAMLGVAGSVAAQTRPIPDDAKRGVIKHVQDVMLSIDGRNIRLAPGGHVRDHNNLIIIPMAIPPEGALADYVLDMHGQVFRAWLLTEEEARRPRKRPAGH